MAIGKHNFISKYTAEQIAHQLGNALVAPVVAYVPEGDIDPPSGHMVLNSGPFLVELLRAIEHCVEHDSWHGHPLVAVERSELVIVSIRLEANNGQPVEKSEI